MDIVILRQLRVRLPAGLGQQERAWITSPRTTAEETQSRGDPAIPSRNGSPNNPIRVRA